MNPLHLPLVIFFIFIFGTSSIAQVGEYRRDSFIEFDVFFKTDQYGLESMEITKLIGLVEAAKTHDRYEIYLKGQADFRGSNGYNDTLAANRVNSVKDFLLSANLSPNAITSSVIGEVPTELDLKDPDKQLRPDRKVAIEARLSYWFTVTQPAPEIKTVYVPTYDCQEKDTVLTFPGGIKIEIEGCAFKCGKIKELNFELKTFFSQEDMLDERLPTISNEGECLRTGGMGFFSVTNQNDCPVETFPDKPMKIYIPTSSFEVTMALWESVEGLSGQVASWKDAQNTLDQVEKDGQKYYVIEVTRNINFNLDVPMGQFAVMQQRPRPFFKVRRFKRKNTEAFMTGMRSNFPANFYKKRKFYFNNVSCIPEEERTVTLFSNKKGKSYVYHVPIENLRRQKRWFIGKGDRFLIRKRDFQNGTKVADFKLDELLTSR